MFLKTRNADAIVIAAVLSGDRNAFAALVARYERAVLGMALSYGSGNVFAEDVAQETFLRAFKDLGRLRDPNRFAPWLMQIARGVAIDYARKNARFQPLSPGEEESIERDPATDELHHMLRQEVARLAPAFREIIVLHYFSGRSTKDIADLLAISKAAAQKRLQRARQDLGANIEKHLPGAFGERRPSAATVASIMAVVATAALPARAQGVVAVSAGALGPGLIVKGIALAVFLLLSTILGWFYFGPGSVPQSPPAVAVAKTPKTAATPAASTEARVRSTPEAASVPVAAGLEDAEPTISGTVADTQGKPVAGAKVVGYAPSGFRAEAETNKEGQYKLEWPAIAPYTLRVHAKGYWPGMLEEINVRSTNADFRLDQAPLIAGRVLRADSKAPLKDAKISIDGEEPVYSGEDGRFQIELESKTYLRAKEEMIQVTADGYMLTEELAGNCLQSDSASSPDILLDPMPFVDVQVVTIAGKPISGAEVHADQLAPANIGESGVVRASPKDVVLGITDARGALVVKTLWNWPNFLYATHPDFASAAMELAEMKGQDSMPLRIVMKQGATITGKVNIFGASPPVGDASIPFEVLARPQAARLSRAAKYTPAESQAEYRRLRRSEPNNFRKLHQLGLMMNEHYAVPPQKSRSNPDGTYTIENVAPGETLVALSYGMADRLLSYMAPLRMTENIDVGSGGVHQVDFNIRVARVHGSLRSALGTPLAGGISYKLERDGLNVSGRTAINKETGYSFLVPAGSSIDLHVHAQATGFQSEEIQTLQIPMAADVEHDIVLSQAGSIVATLNHWNPEGHEYYILEAQMEGGSHASLGEAALLPKESRSHTFEPVNPGLYTIKLKQHVKGHWADSPGPYETILAERVVEVVDSSEYAVEFDVSQIPLESPDTAQ